MSRRDPFREGPPAASARRRRSLAIALMLVAFVALVFGVTLVKMGENRTAARAGAPMGIAD
jgi:hypothetical protein